MKLSPLRSLVTPAAHAEGSDVQLVTCVLADQEYGLPITSVREILRVGAIFAVPRAPAYVRGVVNLRGHVVPILDLRARLGLPEAEATSRSRVIVVEARTRPLGLLVDAVSQVLRVPARAFTSAPQELEQGLLFVQAVATLDTRLILVLDLERALGRDCEGIVPDEHGSSSAASGVNVASVSGLDPAGHEPKTPH